MKSSLPTAGRHDDIVTHWDDYHGDLPAGQAGIPCLPTGRHLTT